MTTSSHPLVTPLVTSHDYRSFSQILLPENQFPKFQLSELPPPNADFPNGRFPECLKVEIVSTESERPKIDKSKKHRIRYLYLLIRHLGIQEIGRLYYRIRRFVENSFDEPPNSRVRTTFMEPAWWIQGFDKTSFDEPVNSRVRTSRSDSRWSRLPPKKTLATPKIGRQREKS